MIIRSTVLALAAAGLAAPAGAQVASDVTEEIRLETRAFAQCIAGKSPAKARELLGKSIGSPGYTREMKILMTRSGCVADPDMATFEPLLLSGALAELALRGGEAARIAPGAAAANPGDPALAMADCAVRADRAGAEKLLAAEWLSDAERDAAFELSAALRPCAPAQPLRITPAQLRALVALALLRAGAA
ncbi:MAG: hypothetical protein ACEQR8_09650 [Cypionkella sp.]